VKYSPTFNLFLLINFTFSLLEEEDLASVGNAIDVPDNQGGGDDDNGSDLLGAVIALAVIVVVGVVAIVGAVIFIKRKQ
jgi:hypothetical protein